MVLHPTVCIILIIFFWITLLIYTLKRKKAMEPDDKVSVIITGINYILSLCICWYPNSKGDVLGYLLLLIHSIAVGMVIWSIGFIKYHDKSFGIKLLISSSLIAIVSLLVCFMVI